jgi:hypothetical protein
MIYFHCLLLYVSGGQLLLPHTNVRMRQGLGIAAAPVSGDGQPRVQQNADFTTVIS